MKLEHSNIGDEKNYAATYKKFKNEVRFSTEYVDLMCNSKYFKHFYSKEYIATIRKQWIE